MRRIALDKVLAALQPLFIDANGLQSQSAQSCRNDK